MLNHYFINKKKRQNIVYDWKLYFHKCRHESVDMNNVVVKQNLRMGKIYLHWQC